MKKGTYLISAVLFFFALGFAALAAAQDAPQRSEGKAKIEGRAGDTNFDLRVQGGEEKRGRTESDRAMPGPQGPSGQRVRRCPFGGDRGLLR